tara:strand:+ start:15837 stop:16397 length:561 start_codon:yes stop_codon:yes gene_type:complete
MAVSAAIIGGAIIGGVMQNKAADKASKANAAQQAKALAFQEKNTNLAIGQIKSGYKFAEKGVLANAEAGKRNLVAQLQAQGKGAGSTMSLAAIRSQSLDASGSIAQLQMQVAQSIAAAQMNKEFPMIQNDGPTGNWAGSMASAAGAAANAWNNRTTPGAAASNPVAGVSASDFTPVSGGNHGGGMG